MVRPLLIAVILIGAGSASVGPVWADVPISGRTQQMCFPRAPVQAAAAHVYHRRMAQLKSRGLLDTDPRVLMRVRRIAARIIAQAILLKPVAAKWQWEVHVTSDPQVAAYAMAGGKLLVGSHFISTYHLTDAQLAVALAHEVGHVIAEHVREQICKASELDPPPPHVKRTVADVIHEMDFDLSIYLRLQPLSRLQEMEADDIGVQLAARSGISPTAIRDFYTKITRSADAPSIFDTHGSRRQREAFVMSMVAYAWAPYRESRHEILPTYAFRP